MNKNLFVISEEEKNRILEMHKEATKKHYLGEQQQIPTKPNTLPRSLSLVKIQGETNPDPVIAPSPLVKAGVPANQKTYKNIFYTNKSGLEASLNSKNMVEFKNQIPQDVKSNEAKDYFFITYDNGSKEELFGGKDVASKVFSTQGLKEIGGSGNGLLALSRAITNTTMKTLQSIGSIEITFSGKRGAEETKYKSEVVNNTQGTFNNLLAFFMKPYVDVSKVDSTNPFLPILNGTSNWTLESVLKVDFLGRIVPKPKEENIQKYKLDMNAPNFKQKFEQKYNENQLDVVWDNLKQEIINQYKFNVEKYLTAAFSKEQATRELSKFNPSSYTEKPSEFLKGLGIKYSPGSSTPAGSPQIRTNQRTFQQGETK